MYALDMTLSFIIVLVSGLRNFTYLYIFIPLHLAYHHE